MVHGGSVSADGGEAAHDELQGGLGIDLWSYDDEQAEESLRQQNMAGTLALRVQISGYPHDATVEQGGLGIASWSDDHDDAWPGRAAASFCSGGR